MLDDAALRGSVRVLGSVRLRPEAREVFLRAVPEFLAATRAEPGCIAYDLFLSASDPAAVATIEHWISADAAASHLVAAHTRDFLGAVSDCSDGTPPRLILLAGAALRLA